MISRDYTWIDDSVEHSDEDGLRAAALAKRWSAIQTQQEERSFRRQSDIEDFGFDGPEPCEECAKCIAHAYDECERIASYEARANEIRADEDLEIELIEDKLARLGARMMRAYEHWNEDEQLMAYMERDRY